MPRKTASPPSPPPPLEQPQTEARDAAPKRDHHGDRTLPPPADFSLSELPDDALLTQREVAAVLRVAVSTVETWRRRGHPLKWATVGGGLVRYRAGDLREFLASTTKPRQPGPKPPSTDEAVRKPKVARKPSRRRADQPAASESELQEQRAR